MPDLSESYCVIGDPVGHSLSPLIHGFIYGELGLSLRYESVRVSPDSLASFVDEVRKTGRPGFNVTIPHKVSILPFLDQLDPLVARTGAVNTVKNQGGVLTGFNTDVHGCRAALEMGGWSPKGRTFILGAGGAARAAVEALSSLGLRQLVLCDIVVERARKLKEDFSKLDTLEITLCSPEQGDVERHLREVDLLINATPVGMWPQVEQSPLARPELLCPGATVFDMVPKPVTTCLLTQARSRGAKTISGLSMLVAQALAAEEIWLDRTLPKELYEQVWKHMVKTTERDG